MQLASKTFINLSDIVRFKNEEDANAVMANWIRRAVSLQYLTILERLNNENFKPADFDAFRSKSWRKCLHYFTKEKERNYKRNWNKCKIHIKKK